MFKDLFIKFYIIKSINNLLIKQADVFVPLIYNGLEKIKYIKSSTIVSAYFVNSVESEKIGYINMLIRNKFNNSVMEY